MANVDAEAAQAAKAMVEKFGVEQALVALSMTIRSLGTDCAEAADGVECVTGYCPCLTAEEVLARMQRQGTR